MELNIKNHKGDKMKIKQGDSKPFVTYHKAIVEKENIFEDCPIVAAPIVMLSLITDALCHLLFNWEVKK
jgi:hypothetical protein